MFKAFVSCLLFLVTIVIDIYMFQDFEPKYLIMIIPMTIFMGALAYFNTKVFIEDIIVKKQNKDRNNETK